VRLAGMVDTVNQIATEVRFVSLLHSVYLSEYCRKGYPKYKKTFGKDQAMKIIQNEKVCGLLSLICSANKRNFLWLKETLDLLTRVVEEEKIDCDLWRGHSFGSQGAGTVSTLHHLHSPTSRRCAEPTMR